MRFLSSSGIVLPHATSRPGGRLAHSWQQDRFVAANNVQKPAPSPMAETTVTVTAGASRKLRCNISVLEPVGSQWPRRAAAPCRPRHWSRSRSSQNQRDCSSAQRWRQRIRPASQVLDRPLGTLASCARYCQPVGSAARRPFSAVAVDLDGNLRTSACFGGCRQN